MLPFILSTLPQSAVSSTYYELHSIITSYGYFGILFLMGLESASLPIPSEVILPAIGYFSNAAVCGPFCLNGYLSFIAAVVGGIIGITVDYFIAFFIGKDLIYKHIEKFHIKKEDLEAFEKWFEKNGAFAVFIGRLVPVVRGLISFPAGFAEMDKKQFYIYSTAGSIIWDAILMGFGYYALSTKNIYLLTISLAAFGIILYLLYTKLLKGIRRQSKA